MPSSTPRRTQVRKEVIEDLEPKPERKHTGSTKEVPVSKIVSDTLTDRISATASYAVSGAMLETVGKEYAITPVEAYNIVYPTSRIIVFYLPGTIIKTSLPPEVADNVEKILITTLEYITRVSSAWVKQQFDKRLIKAGLREQDRPSRNVAPIEPRTPQNSVTPDEVVEAIGEINVPMTGEPIVQVPNGVTHFDFEELIASGDIVGDTGLNY